MRITRSGELAKADEKNALVVLWMEDDPTVTYTLTYADGLVRTYLEDKVDPRAGENLPIFRETLQALQFMTQHRGRGHEGKVLVPIDVARKIRVGDEYAEIQ